MSTRLIFVRHAEAEGNIARVFHGWTDSSITEKGHIQAGRLAERFKDVYVDAVYASSLKRTMQTAVYIAKAKGLHVMPQDSLKEINGGDWEQRRWDELPVLFPEAHDTWERSPHLHKMPNGESMEEFRQRLDAAIMRIIEDNTGKSVVVVTHGTAIRAMMCTFKDCAFERMRDVCWYDNTSVSIVDFIGGRFQVALEGDVSHLDKELRTVENQEWWAEYIKSFKKEE